MKLISVNVGLPRLFSWQGQTFKTGIFKKSVSARVMLRRTNLDGDRQADLSVHGGPDKAVYAYPSEHYEFWKEELPGHAFAWGALGENFTTEGLLETKVSSGDRYRVGSAVVKVTTPRLPCFKLAAKFQPDEIIDPFIRSGYCGFYFSVVEEGEVGAGTNFIFWAEKLPRSRFSTRTGCICPPAITRSCSNAARACKRCPRAGVRDSRRNSTPSMPPDLKGTRGCDSLEFQLERSPRLPLGCQV